MKGVGMSKTLVIFLFILQTTFTFARIASFSFNQKKFPRVTEFSWSNCGLRDDPIEIDSLYVTPDPILVPGNVSVAIDVTFREPLTSPSPLSVTIEKKVAFVWIKIPCEKGAGSCDYSDFCKMWPIPKKCPQAYKKYGIPCECPFHIGKYGLPSTPIIDMTQAPIPKWMENGEYSAKIILNDPKGHRMTCTLLYFTLKAD